MFIENGTATYTPDANYFGSDTVTLTATDDMGAVSTSTSNMTITSVNDAPVVSATPLTAVMDEDNTLVLTQEDLLANASDLEGDSLTAFNVQVNGNDATVVDNGEGT